MIFLSSSARSGAAAVCSCSVCAVFPLLHVAHDRGTYL